VDVVPYFHDVETSVHLQVHQTIQLQLMASVVEEEPMHWLDAEHDAQHDAHVLTALRLYVHAVTSGKVIWKNDQHVHAPSVDGGDYGRDVRECGYGHADVRVHVMHPNYDHGHAHVAMRVRAGYDVRAHEYAVHAHGADAQDYERGHA
jgi:hypothetical protein